MTNTLLIVDDEESILKSLQRLFRKQPFQVLLASSPEEALDLFNANEVSVVLSDQRMPGMNGSEFLKRVRTTHPESIRIIMSGYTELDSITSAINDGAVFKFLTKPWNDEQLIEHIHEAFEIYNLRRNNHRLNEALQEANRQLSERCADLQSISGLQQDILSLTQSILEQVPTEILCVDSEGQVVLANPAARRVFGHDTLFGRAAADVLPAALRSAITRMQASDQSGPERAVLPDGSAFQLCRLSHPGGDGGIVVSRHHGADEGDNA